MADFPEDPSKTAGIRRRWQAQASLRFAELKRRIRKLLATGDEGGIPVPAIDPRTLTANKFEYANDPMATLRFMAWLQLQIQAVIIGNDATPGSNWQNRYIDQSYSRGIERTQADLRRQGLNAVMMQSVTAAEIVGTASSRLGLGDVNGPIHQEAIRTLYLRAYDGLNGVTDEMSRQIRRVLVDGVEQGLGVRDIAAGILDRVDAIGETRARLIARTETVRAYNVSAVAEFEDVAARAGIEPQYKWLTAGDARVRPEHARRDGKVYDAAEALRLIGEPNCRCSLAPYIDPDLMKDAAA